MIAIAAYWLVGTVVGVWAVAEHARDRDIQQVMGPLNLADMVAMVALFQWLWLPLMVLRSNDDGPWRG